MSCAYRTHRYRSGVTAHPTSVSWQHPTDHAQHPIFLRLLVVRPDQQAVTETSTSTDDALIPVSLIQYLWSQWYGMTPADRNAVVEVIGALMQSPHWHWNVTVLPDQSLPDPQDPFVSERDGRPTIGIPIAMLRDLWRWVLDHIDERAAVLRWWAIDPALWQRLRAWQTSYAPEETTAHRYRLYPYLLPTHLPELVQEMHHLLASTNPNDQHIALTVLDRWLASPDHETRTVAAQMLHTLPDEEHHLRLPIITILVASGDATMDVDRWAHHVATFIRTHPSDRMIQDMLDRLMPAILSSVRPDDRARWVATLWDLMNESTLGGCCLMIAGVLAKMMQQDPMVARLVCDRLHTVSPLHRSRLPFIPRRTWDTLLTGLMRTVYAGEVLEGIAQAIRQDPNTIAEFAPMVADRWGYGGDQRILQMVTSFPSPHWRPVLTQGITTSVGAEVCARITQDDSDDAVRRIAEHIHAKECWDWPLAPLPVSLIPWVCEAARACPNHLLSDTIRRLWLADPDRVWDVTQTMLHSDGPSKQVRALEAMDAGMGHRARCRIVWNGNAAVRFHRHMVDVSLLFIAGPSRVSEDTHNQQASKRQPAPPGWRWPSNVIAS